MRILRRCLTSGLALGAVIVVAGCGSSGSNSSTSKSGGGSATSAASGAASSSGSSSKATGSPVTIGTSLSLSGDFSTDGQAFERGYKLWAADQNKAGGLLGHPVKLDVLSDASSPAQVVTNYQKLIGSNKDAARLRPVLVAAHRSRGPHRRPVRVRLRRGRRRRARRCSAAGLHNVFDVSIPVKDNLVTFAQWVASLPPSKRPKTAAYARQRPVHPAPAAPWPRRSSRRPESRPS